jgi:large subunit ribosomal protein L17
MFRNMVTSLLKYERIRTTDAKAKELRRWTDRIITLAKRGDLHARRQALAIVREKDVVHKLFEQAQERFGKINGGYTRIVKLGRRPGDAAPVSLIELISMDEVDKKKKTKAPAKKATKAAAKEAPAKKAKAKADKASPDAEKEKKTKEPIAEQELEDETPADDTAKEADAAVVIEDADSEDESAESAPEAKAEPAKEAKPAAKKKPVKKKAEKKED